MSESQPGSAKRQWLNGLFGGLTALATVLTGIGALVGVTRTFFAGPRVVSFVAEPESVRPGEPFVLSWTVEEADKVIIEPRIGEVSLEGKRTLRPSRNTEYTLTAEKGLTRKTVQLTVTIAEATVPPRSLPSPDVQPAPAVEPAPVPVPEQRNPDAAPEPETFQKLTFRGTGVVLKGLAGDAPPEAQVEIVPVGANQVKIEIKLASGSGLTRTVQAGSGLTESEKIAGGTVDYKLNYTPERVNLETSTHYTDDRLDREVRFELTREQSRLE